MIQVALPELVVEKLQAVAERDGSELADVLVEAVEQYIALTYPVTVQTGSGEDPAWKAAWEEQKRRIDVEQRIYESQHPTLFKQYAGQHIAMYQGQVVDHDEDGAELHRRIRLRFGNTPVLVTPVLSTPRQTIRLRGPRLFRKTRYDSVAVSD